MFYASGFSGTYFHDLLRFILSLVPARMVFPLPTANRIGSSGANPVWAIRLSNSSDAA
jgi:hypothetical protein